MMEFDLRQLIRSLRRRFWIVLVMIAVAGTGGYAGASLQAPQYSSSAIVMVAPTATDGNQIASMQASLGVAETYRMLIETGPVLERVIDDLDLPYSIEALEQKVTATSIGDTLLIRITVIDQEAEQAALIANAVVDAFQQVVVGEIDPHLGNQIELVNPARTPSAPFAPDVPRSVAIGSFVGLILSVGVIALLEISDNTVKGDIDFMSLFGAPLLAAVPAVDGVKTGEDALFILRQPRSSASEVIRLLRTNLEFAGATSPVRSVTVTSPGAGEGKSTVAANLAVAVAQAGMRTVLVDADLRNPTQHRLFGLKNRRGLTNLLMHPELGWRTIADPIRMAPGLSVLSSGPLPPNPSDLLQSSRYADLLGGIANDVDLVVVDTPPALAVSDPLIAARRTDGIVVVCRNGKTRIDAMRQVSSAVAQGNIRLLGVVLNDARPRHAEYYGTYYPEDPASVPHPRPDETPVPASGSSPSLPVAS